jgi:hypothetical protein
MMINYPEIDPTEVYTEDALQWLYNEFLALSNLAHLSAEDLILEVRDHAQRAWLSQFITSWEQMQALADETEWHEYALIKSGIK